MGTSGDSGGGSTSKERNYQTIVYHWLSKKAPLKALRHRAWFSKENAIRSSETCKQKTAKAGTEVTMLSHTSGVRNFKDSTEEGETYIHSAERAEGGQAVSGRGASCCWQADVGSRVTQ